MDETKKSTKERLAAFLKSPKGVKIAVALLIVAAALIALSDFFPKKTAAPAEKTETQTAAQIEERLEKRLETLLEGMAGVGECHVMVFLSGSETTEYATERKESRTNEQKADKSSAGSSQTEEKYIIMEDRDGNQTALVRFSSTPPICGVAVVCTGGSSAAVRKRVSDTVKTVLGIGSDRICVTDAR